MDPLEDIFSGTRVLQAVYAHLEARAPWGINFREGDGARFGLVVRGGCRLKLHDSRETISLATGDCFVIASALCGLAPTAAVLVVARIAQGASGALLLPQVTAMLGGLYSGEQRARAFAAYGLALGLGAASGQLIGGALIHADVGGLGWRSCFLINVPIGALALLLAPRVLPALPAQRTSRLDVAGAALLAVSLTALLLPLVQGCGLGMVMAPLVATLLAGLPPEHAGVAAGVLSTVQQLGNALGVALIGIVFYGAGSAGFAHSLIYLLATSLIVAVLYRRFIKETLQ